MKSIKLILLGVIIIITSSFHKGIKENYSLSVTAEHVRNSKGIVQFALYNKNGTIPDEHYKKYLKIGTGKIINGKATFTFSNLPEGKYAVNILHDENENGKLDKGFILPKEGIGFSNFQSIGLSNKPNFTKASFDVKEDKSIVIKMIYL